MGYLGVDVFFVISGYVVTKSITYYKVGFFDFIRIFYSKRFLRIYPALIVTLLITFILYVLFIPKAWISNGIENVGISAFFGLSNVVLNKTSSNYFAPISELNPFTQTWSLGVEEQFYALCPLILYTLTKSSTKYIKIATSLLFLFVVLSMFYSYFSAIDNQSTAFYSIFSRFWQLGLGSLLAVTFIQSKSRLKASARIEILYTIILLSLVLMFFIEFANIPYPGSIPVVILTIFLLGLGGIYEFRSLFTQYPIIRYIGKTSYSIYLIHWPIIVVLQWTVGIESLPIQFVALSTSLLFGFLMNKYVENKFRHLSKNLSLTKLLLISSSSIAISLSFVYTITKYKQSLSFVWSDIYHDKWHAELNYKRSEAKTLCDVDFKFVESEFGSKKIIYEPINCASQNNKLYVVGNSHAGMIGSMLERLAVEHGIKSEIITKDGCPYINLMEPTNSRIECTNYSLWLTSYLVNEVPIGSMVAFSSLNLKRISEQDGSYDPNIINKMFVGNALKGRDNALTEAVGLFNQLRKTGKSTLYVLPFPMFSYPPFRCLNSFNSMNPICRMNDKTPSDSYLLARENIVYEVENILKPDYIFDPFPLLCPNNICNTPTKEQSILFDGDHITPYALTLIYPYFYRMISQ